LIHRRSTNGRRRQDAREETELFVSKEKGTEKAMDVAINGISDRRGRSS